MKTRTDIYQFQGRLGRRLIRWGGLSTGLGAVLALLGSPFWRGVGGQFAGWGLIDALIGGVGVRSARSKAAEPEAYTAETQSQERTTLRRILSINAGLDVLYVAGGLILARAKRKESRFWEGSAIGIAVQGGFLLVFDLIHVLLLRDGA